VRHPWLLLSWSKQFKALKQTMTATSPTATTENREIVNPKFAESQNILGKKAGVLYEKHKYFLERTLHFTQ
jgi:hypothetical protein